MARLLLIGPTAQVVPHVCDVLAQEGVLVTAAANTYEGLAAASATRRSVGMRDMAYLVIDDHVSDLPPGGSLRAKRVALWDWVVARCTRAVRCIPPSGVPTSAATLGESNA